MLRYLHIQNIAVIEDLEVEFGSGLNVITGETGSGKSILIDSLGLLLGGRASTDMIRTGQERATVEGMWQLERLCPLWEALAGQGIDADRDEGMLLVRREISSGGPGRVHINGRLATVGSLRELATWLAEIHGQHDTRLLLQPRYHLDLLDAFHGREELVAQVGRTAAAIHARRNDLERLSQDEHARLQRLDFLNFQITEIEDAALAAGEEEQLKEERQLLANAEKLFQIANEGYEGLYEAEDSVINRVNHLIQGVEGLVGVDGRLARIGESLRNSLYQLEDVAYFLRDYAGNVEVNEARLDELEARLALIDRLKRKYGGSVEEILEYFEQISEEKNNLDGSDKKRSILEKELEELTAEYRTAAGELSAIRQSAAREIEGRVETHLGHLAMGSTRFHVDIRSVTDPDACPATGVDQLEFQVSPNIGEELRPLRKIASGGELSRLTLALKLVLQTDEDVTLVFDEVDTGIGGGTAEMVGRKLKVVSTAGQTFCITHVPQIAALADRHYRVEKVVEAGRTRTRITPLDAAEKVEELARMLGGVSITDVTRQHARQLLEANGVSTGPAE